MEYTIPKIRDKIRLFEKTGKETATLFLTPAELQEALTILKGYDYTITGGFEEAERRIIIVGNEKADAAEYLEAIRVMSKEKPLQHRSVLGSVLGLGLKREVIGDIIVKDNICDIIATQEIKSFLLQNLKQIGREKVTVTEITLSEILPIDAGQEIRTVSVASLRADAIISSAYGLAREKAATLFTQEKVLLNFMPCLNQAKAVKENDLLSVRGFGRIRLEEVVRRNA